MAIQAVEPTARFLRDYKRLDSATQALVDNVLEALMPWPTSTRLRHHTLSGYKPPVHVVDVTSSHSHQVTFRLEGTVARLLRVGTHALISRSPL